MNRVPNLEKNNFSTGNSLPAETHPHDSVQQEGDAKTTICDFSGGKPGLTAALQGTRWLRRTAAVISSSSKPKSISEMANCMLLGLTKMWGPVIFPNSLGEVRGSPCLQMPVMKYHGQQRHSWQDHWLLSGAFQHDGQSKNRAHEPASNSRHMRDDHITIPCTRGYPHHEYFSFPGLLSL